jgi:hypothetical protein
MKMNENKQMRNSNESDGDTTIHRVNKHSYIVSFDKLQRETDIHMNLLRNKENLLINQGFIHIKEYTIDGYECRCEEHKNEIINNEKYLFNYKLKF